MGIIIAKHDSASNQVVKKKYSLISRIFYPCYQKNSHKNCIIPVNSPFKIMPSTDSNHRHSHKLDPLPSVCSEKSDKKSEKKLKALEISSKSSKNEQNAEKHNKSPAIDEKYEKTPIFDQVTEEKSPKTFQKFGKLSENDTRNPSLRPSSNDINKLQVTQQTFMEPKSNTSDTKTLHLNEIINKSEAPLEDSILINPLPTTFDVANGGNNETFEKGDVSEIEDNGEEIQDIGLNEIQMSFQKGNKIGKGPHGKVYESLNLVNGEILAVKTLEFKGLDKENAGYFQKNLLELKHENILAYKDFGYADKNKRSIELVSEYIAGGSLKNLLEKFGKFEEIVSSLFTSQILAGLQFLHNKSILHKNLKSTNCLVESNGTVKLSDYCLLPLSFSSEASQNQLSNPDLIESKSISECQSVLSNSVKPYDSFDERHWMSPEVYYSSLYLDKSDIWSLGCIVYEMLIGESLLCRAWKKGIDIDNYYTDINGLLSEGLSINAKSFLTDALRYKPEDRVSLSGLLSHPFIKKSGMEVIEEENEAGLIQLNTGGLLENKSLIEGNNDNRSNVSKSNFSILASLINMSSNSHYSAGIKPMKKLMPKQPNNNTNSNNNSSIKKKETGKCEFFKKKVSKILDDENKMVESHRITEENDSIDDFAKKRLEFEKNLKEVAESKENTIDFNAKKRMEFEENMMKEVDMKKEKEENLLNMLGEQKKEDTIDFNKKKRMEFEKNMMKEFEGQE